MRSLGDSRWINKYIGIPYLKGGRGPDSFDCYGLCVSVYHDQYGITLPDWKGVESWDMRKRAKLIGSIANSNQWKEKDVPDDGDFVVVRRTQAAWHMGLVFAGCVLHCYESQGVVFEPLKVFQLRFGNVVFGSWNI